MNSAVDERDTITADDDVALDQRVLTALAGFGITGTMAQQCLEGAKRQVAALQKVATTGFTGFWQ